MQNFDSSYVETIYCIFISTEYTFLARINKIFISIVIFQTIC